MKGEDKITTTIATAKSIKILPRFTDVDSESPWYAQENDDGTVFITIEITVLNIVIFVIDIDNFCKQNVPIIS